jgi:protein gp37
VTTLIEWTDETWNPVAGCDKVSPGCDHCYAENIARRFAGTKAFPDGFAVTLHPDRIERPLHWRRPRRVFVNSMSDLFHQDITDDYIARVFAVMQLAGQHQFQVLTKRAKRLFTLVGSRPFLDLVDDAREQLRPGCGDFTWPAPNIWLGVSIETDRYTFRADYLTETPAAIRFLSCEPLLGPLPSLNLSAIDWVIAGGESGPGARPMDPDWARALRDDCVNLGVPFFFKQWGGRTPKTGGRELDGRTWDEYPTVGGGPCN